MSAFKGRAWRLDVLDPLAGLAFASYRISQVEVESLDAGIPAVFIGAPSFRPVNLTNRAIGLSAARRTFQAGLFLKGEEVGFPDLEGAIEFVRRCYVRGGGGAGGGPGGGPPVPREPGPESPGPELPAPELPRPDFDEIDRGERRGTPEAASLMAMLRADLQKYNNLSKDLDAQSPGQSSQMAWMQPVGSGRRTALLGAPSTGSSDGADILARGALRVVDEMFRRAPAYSTDSEGFVDWLVAFLRLVRAIRRMGLVWPMWSHGGYFNQMFDALAKIAANQKQLELFEWCEWFRGSSPNSIEDLFYYTWRNGDHEWTDAMDDLGLWPVPSGLGVTLNDSEHSPTLLNYLAAFLANPPVVGGSSPNVPDIDVALFAAARIVASCARNWGNDSGGTFHLPSYAVHDKIRHRITGRLAEAAYGWLVGELPRRAFGPLLEKTVEQASSLVAA
jgi:hypothetical protein